MGILDVGELVVEGFFLVSKASEIRIHQRSHGSSLGRGYERKKFTDLFAFLRYLL